MPNGDPRDNFFYPTLTLMIDSYNIVKKMDLKDFFDFKSLAGNVRNFDLDTDRSKIRWNKNKNNETAFRKPQFGEVPI